MEVAIVCFYCIPNRFKIEQSDTLQHNGITIRKWKYACENSFVMSNWKLLFLKMRRVPH